MAEVVSVGPDVYHGFVARLGNVVSIGFDPASLIYLPLVLTAKFRVDDGVIDVAIITNGNVRLDAPDGIVSFI